MRRLAVSLLLVGLPGLAVPALAQGTEVQDSVIVSGPVRPDPAVVPAADGQVPVVEPVQIAGVNGRLAVNLAAGNGNQQINGAILSMGDVAQSGGVVVQRSLSNDRSDRVTHIALEGEAFGNSSGLISVNIAAGNQNQMANLAVIGVGSLGVLSDALLEQSRASTEPSGSTGGTGQRNDTIAVSDDAFRDSSGLIQVNLIGGERNSSANTFVLSVLDTKGSP